MNPEKLTGELLAAGLPVVSVDADGNIGYSRALTPTEEATAAAVIAEHVPTDYAAIQTSDAITAARSLINGLGVLAARDAAYCVFARRMAQQYGESYAGIDTLTEAEAWVTNNADFAALPVGSRRFIGRMIRSFIDLSVIATLWRPRPD